MRRNIEIRTPGAAGNRADILIDGEKVTGVTAFRIDGEVRRPARLTLDLSVHETNYFGEADVFVSDRARETLIHFGWTPPPVSLEK